MGKAPTTKPSTSTQAASPTAPVTPLFCTADGCKAKESRFSFCAEHYEQFKFGLIKKDGKQAADYYKKMEHYQAFLERQKSARKAA